MNTCISTESVKISAVYELQEVRIADSHWQLHSICHPQVLYYEKFWSLLHFIQMLQGMATSIPFCATHPNYLTGCIGAKLYKRPFNNHVTPKFTHFNHPYPLYGNKSTNTFTHCYLTF